MILQLHITDAELKTALENKGFIVIKVEVSEFTSAYHNRLKEVITTKLYAKLPEKKIAWEAKEVLEHVIKNQFLGWGISYNNLLKNVTYINL